MSLPWKAGEPLSLEAHLRLRRQAAFKFHKWDQQVGDVTTFCPYPLMIDQAAWDEVSAWSELLAAEIQAAERELVTRPDLHAELGLPVPIVRLLREAHPASCGHARLIRFDFHLTIEGWRISEANTDVPGGWNEATGYPELMASFYPESQPVEGMLEKYSHSLTENLLPGAHIALVHATAYTDDRQAMVFLAEKLQILGFSSSLVSPEQIVWESGQAHVRTDWHNGPVGLLVRYYPGEWLPNLPRKDSWRHFFAGSSTPLSNPATALLTQSKRLPLVWDKLATPLPVWRKLLPPSADTRQVDWQTGREWIAKPALGRVGHGIGLRECLSEKEWNEIGKQVRRHPGEWIAQRRFQIIPLSIPGGEGYPCLGVYTIDGKVAGAYGRIASRPLIDNQARDIAIFINSSS